MGEAESEGTPSRKRKEKLETANSDGCPEKKAKIFCCRIFRRDLRGNEALKSLKWFVNSAKSSDDVVNEYLDGGGSVQEILSLIDSTATGDLTTALPVFEAVHLIFLRFQSSDSKHHVQCIENARMILHSHLLVIKTMLTMNVAKQKKVALKVLTVIATLDSSFASEIINVIALSPTLLTDLIQPSSEKESVRKCFILFVLSFLIKGNMAVVKNLLEKKGFLSSIIPGLKFDEAATVNLTLSLFEDKILKNVKIPKTLKLKIFNTQIMKSLFDLYDWKGIQGVKHILPRQKSKMKEVVVNQNEKELVIESVHSFLLLLCCSQKYGIAFYDKSLGTSEQLNNQLLLTVFESITDPLKNRKVAEVLLKTIVSCPDLMKPVLHKLEPSFQPRNSKNWFHAIDFGEKLIKTLDVTSLLKNETEPLTANHIVKVAKALCAPVVFLRVIKLGSQKAQPLEIQLRCLRLLATIWSEIQRLSTLFQNFQDLSKSLNKHVSKFLPDVEDLVELWHNLCNAEFFASLPFSQENKILFLFAVLESLHIVMECQTEVVNFPLSLVSDLLSHIEIIKESMSGKELDDVKVKIVQFVEMDLEGLKSYMELFEKSLFILLRSTDDSAISYLSKILSTLKVFAKNKAEIDVWLLSYMSLPVEYRASVAEFLIQSVRSSFGDSGDDELNDVSKGSDDTQRTAKLSPAPLLFNCLETLKSHSSESSKENEKLFPFRHYLNDVIIHLQHFYPVDVYLYDQLKGSKVIGKSILGYLKAWKNNSTKKPEPEVFPCPLELDLVSWLVSDAPRKIIDVENTNFLKLYSLFRIVVAYLTRKTIIGEFSERDMEKLTEILSFLLGRGPEDESENVDLISNDAKNKSVYRRHCLDCLYRNEYLLKGFDVFQRKENAVFYTTKIVFKVLMEREVVKSSTTKRILSERWKLKFLEQLKAKLRKQKGIDGLESFEKVFDFFDYGLPDVAEMIQLLSASDLNLFLNGDALSAWAFVLSKFLRMNYQMKEVDETAFKRLCDITKNLLICCRDSEELLDCFVYLLRKYPSHLLSFDNDFLDIILLSSNATTATLTLGKLLLNDPSKFDYFLNFTTAYVKKLDKSIIFPLLSTVIINEDSFLAKVQLESEHSVWKIPITSDVLKVLEMVWKKYEKNILNALVGEKEDEIFFINSPLTRDLIKLFLDERGAMKLQKKINKINFKLNAAELVFEVVKKYKMGGWYLEGLLFQLCRVIKQSDEVDWTRYDSLVSNLIALEKGSSWKELIVSQEWKEFPKMVLGYCLSSTKHFSLIKILRSLITAFYKPGEESKECGLFFQMLISHSNFLKVILSHSPLKSEIVELFLCLIERSSSEMSPKHFPILLASYTASMSPCDRTLLKVLKFYEKSGMEVSNYEPLIWGDAAVSHYSVGTSPGLSLWQRFNMGNVLDLLDTQTMELSLKEFPLRRTIQESQTEDAVCDSRVYDPAFLLPLFSNLLSPGSVVFCLAFIYKGGLAYAVRALSSECKEVRLTASVVLTRFYNHLEMSQNLKQKLVWMHFINCLRYGIEDLSSEPVSNIASLFFGKMTLELSRHPAEMYSPLQNFLLAKPYFTFDTVPEFLPLFHSSDVGYWKHRTWLLEVMRDGTKTPSDVKLIYHSMAPKVFFCFFHSQLCDNESKKLILQVVEKMLQIDKGILLISEYGVLNWLTSVDSGSLPTILHELLSLLSTLADVIVKDIQIGKSKHSNSSHLIQILNLAMKLLPSLKQTKSVEPFKIYLKLVKHCLAFSYKETKTDWFKLNKSRLSDLIDAGVVILGENYDIFTKLPFYFEDFQGGGEFADLKDSIFLFNKLVK